MPLLTMLLTKDPAAKLRPQRYLRHGRDTALHVLRPRRFGAVEEELISKNGRTSRIMVLLEAGVPGHVAEAEVAGVGVTWCW